MEEHVTPPQGESKVGRLISYIARAGCIQTAMKRALIVIDVQNDYFDGALAIAYPDRTRSLANVVAAMEAAHAAGVAVVVVESVLPETAPIFAKGSHGAELHPSIADKPRDRLLSKGLPSSPAARSPSSSPLRSPSSPHCLPSSQVS